MQVRLVWRSQGNRYRRQRLPQINRRLHEAWRADLRVIRPDLQVDAFDLSRINAAAASPSELNKPRRVQNRPRIFRKTS